MAFLLATITPRALAPSLSSPEPLFARLQKRGHIEFLRHAAVMMIDGLHTYKIRPLFLERRRAHVPAAVSG